MARKWWTLLLANVAGFVLLLDVSIVNVALPAIQADLDSTLAGLQWVVDAYVLTLAALLLAAGSLADTFGRRRVFVLGLALFGLASLACAMAWSPLALGLARGAQGVGGAAMFATSLALLSREFAPRERGMAFGILGATTGAALAVGPLVGGVLSEGLDWRWIFIVNLPVVAVALPLAMTRLVESRNPAATRFDWPGVVALATFLSALVLALIQGNEAGWQSVFILGLLATSLVSLSLFIMIERRAQSPLLDLTLLREKSFVGVSVAAFALAASGFSVLLYLSLYLHNVLGHSAWETGVRFLPITGAAFVVSPVAGRLSARVPARVFIGGGLVLVSLGLALMAGLTPQSDAGDLLVGSVVVGVGMGLVNPVLLSTAMMVIPPARAGMASGFNNTCRQVGLATGIAGLGVLFQAALQNRLEDLVGVRLAEEVAGPLASGALVSTTDAAVLDAAREAFVGALDAVLWAAAGVAIAGALAAILLIQVAPAVSRRAAGQHRAANMGDERVVRSSTSAAPTV